eukprot:2677127-Rhodomonas_salina.3
MNVICHLSSGLAFEGPELSSDSLQGAGIEALSFNLGGTGAEFGSKEFAWDVLSTNCTVKDYS